ncbi:T9SS type A sorting domain-containing protein [Polaribacter sp. IC073]|uniref:T9SS type A sorting domain-containing protein n=1 Tax=Polaribacter sp. IC073 TaxID=2508540 RepID=UPI0011BF5869|nr:T9SS type A sorting domain-containing protein [Polaribacter sp. IC073]TXD47688.1 T9SS type A sorting domain-containing protein [Polaribacter sp. IC073]
MVDLSNTGTIVAKTSTRKKEKEKQSILKLGLLFNMSDTAQINRQVAIVFKGLSDNFDKGSDAEMWALRPTDFHLKVKNKDQPFIITGIEFFNNLIKVPLVVQVDKERELTFCIDEKINIDAPIYLFDAILNTFSNLSDGPIKINLPLGTYTERFFITFSNKTLSNNDVDENEYLISVYDKDGGTLIIENKLNLEIEAVKVYNLLGAEVFNSEVEKNKVELRFNLGEISKGVYIVVIQTAKGIINKKILIE